MKKVRYKKFTWLNNYSSIVVNACFCFRQDSTANLNHGVVQSCQDGRDIGIEVIVENAVRIIEEKRVECLLFRAMYIVRKELLERDERSREDQWGLVMVFEFRSSIVLPIYYITEKFEMTYIKPILKAVKTQKCTLFLHLNNFPLKDEDISLNCSLSGLNFKPTHIEQVKYLYNVQ